MMIRLLEMKNFVFLFTGRSNTEIVEPNDYTGINCIRNSSWNWQLCCLGPKLFVKPSAKSNRSIIMNAVSHCCLAGDVNSDKKQKVLEAIGRSTANHFIILFRGAGQQYRGLYSYFPETEDIIKVSGIGPTPLTNKMMDGFYKWVAKKKIIINEFEFFSSHILDIIPEERVSPVLKLLSIYLYRLTQ